jgi:hypothetical protein
MLAHTMLTFFVFWLFFLSVLADFTPPGIRNADPDPDSGSQSDADPDPKH